MAKAKKAAKKKRQRQADDDEGEKTNPKHEKKEKGTEESEENKETLENEENQSDDEDDAVSLMELDPEFKVADDEPPEKELRRNKGHKFRPWEKEILQQYGMKYLDKMKDQLGSEQPDFDRIEEVFDRINTKLREANKKQKVPGWKGDKLQKNFYRVTYKSLIDYIGHKTDDPSAQWKMFYDARKSFHQFNRQNNLPSTWNVPDIFAERNLPERPDELNEPSYDDDDAESAVSYVSAESESEDEGGIDALETRMRKEYSPLSQGKVLYWWSVGTGTQIFVRYGPKKTPIYRIRAGSSMPWDPRSTEQVLSKTPGNAKRIQQAQDGQKIETWKYSRDDVQDIKGVGWKVEGDDDASGDSVALIRSVKDATYPHTRVLVKWMDSKVSLERRGFVRRIANGSSLNGDRMIYFKAKEMETAYWGYDIDGSDENSSASDSSSSSESDYPQTRSRRTGKRQGRARPPKKYLSSTESDRTEDSDIEAEKRKRQSKWLKHRKTRGKKKIKSEDEPRNDDYIRYLENRLGRMRLEQHHDSPRKTRRHRA